MKKLALILLFFSTHILAGDMDPKPIQNNDLREGKEVFSWSFKGETMTLFLQGENEYHLVHQKDKKKIHQKISSSKAEQIDQEFVSKFIENKYSREDKVEKNCGQTSKMTMRGEIFEFCVAKSKPKGLDTFWEELNNNFTN